MYVCNIVTDISRQKRRRIFIRITKRM